MGWECHPQVSREGGKRKALVDTGSLGLHLLGKESPSREDWSKLPMPLLQSEAGAELILPGASFAGTRESVFQSVEMVIAKPLYFWCCYWQGSGSAIQF